MLNLQEFLNNSPTSFQAIKTISEILETNGYKQLLENQEYQLEKGGKYYVTRNGSSIIALNIGKKLDNPSIQITASHSDCPSFKLKPNSIISNEHYVKLDTEIYGGPLFYPWLDRMLSIAGRVIVKEENGIKILPFDYKEPFGIIPSVAIHMNRGVNESLKLNPQVDLLPLVSDKKEFNMKEFLASKLSINKEKVMNYDLYLYPIDKATIWGDEKQYISSFHLDNLQCAYANLVGFVDNFNENNINVYACFDNEEVGSLTRQGADSDFMDNTLTRVTESLKVDLRKALANGMQLSCDNAHAVHPNHPELTDQVNNTYMNKGVVVKFNANQSYTSDSVSCGIITSLMEKENVPYQFFANRSDSRGGSTLGNLSNRHLSILSVDLGLPQLAMHSCYETAGTLDTEYLIKTTKAFYNAHLEMNENKYLIR